MPSEVHEGKGEQGEKCKTRNRTFGGEPTFSTATVLGAAAAAAAAVQATELQGGQPYTNIHSLQNVAQVDVFLLAERVGEETELVGDRQTLASFVTGLDQLHVVVDIRPPHTQTHTHTNTHKHTRARTRAKRFVC